MDAAEQQIEAYSRKARTWRDQAEREDFRLTLEDDSGLRARALWPEIGECGPHGLDEVAILTIAAMIRDAVTDVQVNMSAGHVKDVALLQGALARANRDKDTLLSSNALILEYQKEIQARADAMQAENTRLVGERRQLVDDIEQVISVTLEGGRLPNTTDFIREIQKILAGVK